MYIFLLYTLYVVPEKALKSQGQHLTMPVNYSGAGAYFVTQSATPSMTVRCHRWCQIISTFHLNLDIAQPLPGLGRPRSRMFSQFWLACSSKWLLAGSSRNHLAAVAQSYFGSIWLADEDMAL